MQLVQWGDEPLVTMGKRLAGKTVIYLSIVMITFLIMTIHTLQKSLVFTFLNDNGSELNL